MPGRHADRHRDHEGHGAKLQRHRQLLRDQRAHRLADAPGIAEVAVQHVADPVQILHRQRAVEPQFGADLRQHRGSPRSSPASTSAGSPGMSCCRPNTRMLTSSSVGMICGMRAPRCPFTTRPPALQPDHAVRHRPEALTLSPTCRRCCADVEIVSGRSCRTCRHIGCRAPCAWPVRLDARLVQQLSTAGLP